MVYLYIYMKNDNSELILSKNNNSELSEFNYLLF